jgi:anti-sigma factor RsiW
MKTLLSALSDGTLAGLARWYTEQHVKGCPGCAAGLKALRGLRDRLRALASGGGAATMVEPQPALPGERRAAVLRAWADAEQRHEEKTRTP